MELVDIPLFTPQAKVTETIDYLRLRHRSGLVTEARDNYNLFYTGELLRARDHGLVTLEQIQNPHKVMLVHQAHVKSFKIDLVRPLRTQKQYARLLGEYGLGYGLVAASSDTAMIVTASESSALALMLTGGFKCTGKPTHYFPLPRVKPKEDCPKYPECSRADNKRPWIELVI